MEMKTTYDIVQEQNPTSIDKVFTSKIALDKSHQPTA